MTTTPDYEARLWTAEARRWYLRRHAGYYVPCPCCGTEATRIQITDDGCCWDCEAAISRANDPELHARLDARDAAAKARGDSAAFGGLLP
jgi:hypothetical protein